MVEDRQAARRRLVDALLGIGLTGSAVSFLYPVLKFVLPPRLAEPAEWSVEAGKAGELPPGSGKIFKFGRRPAILINTPAGELRAFDAICTHLNCTVQYRPDFAHIWCACHNGHYDLFGKNISGPPPRPLPRFDVAIRDDTVVVTRGGDGSSL